MDSQQQDLEPQSKEDHELQQSKNKLNLDNNMTQSLNQSVQQTLELQVDREDEATHVPLTAREQKSPKKMRLPDLSIEVD